MADDTGGDTYGRRSVLKMSGAALATTVGVTGPVQAAGGPAAPENVEAIDRTDGGVELDWDGPSDADHYEIEVSGYSCGHKGCYTTGHVTSDSASSAPYWVEDLPPSNSYKFYVYSVDADGNRSDAAGTTVHATDSRWESVHASGDWDQSTNALGGDWKAEHFVNGDGEVTDDGLYLDYDADGGIFWTDVDDPDSDEYWTVPDADEKAIAFLVRGANGGESVDAALTWDAEDTRTNVWTEYMPYHILDEGWNVVRIPLHKSGYYQHWFVDVPGQLKLEFHKERDRDSALTIDSVWISEYRYH